MKQKYGIGILIGAGLALWLVFGMTLLAVNHPFAPGSVLFPFQRASERMYIGLTFNKAGKAEIALKLAERRLVELARADQPKQVERSAEAFSQALAESEQCIQAAPQTWQTYLQGRSDRVMQQARVVVLALEPYREAAAVSALFKLFQIELSAPADPLTDPLTAAAVDVDSVAVSFLGVPFEHETFKLEGGHVLECNECHTTGEYAGIPTSCESCHEYSTEIYTDHFPGECVDCHDVFSWRPAEFDHELALECLSCHAGDIPDEAEYGSHYPGECDLCHIDVQDWSVYEYDHNQVTECESCHSVHAPKEHYPGEETCTDCHKSIESWYEVEGKHTIFTECQSCHAGDLPQPHFSGQCSYCHVSQNWEEISFVHNLDYSCNICHRPPVDHYAQNCQSCHSPGAWSNSRFVHIEMTNCTKCHNAPGGHYSGSCTNCHTTSSWGLTGFDHSRYPDCQSCHSLDAPRGHYSGQCSNCHSSTTWQMDTYKHTSGDQDCTSCHANDAPAVHYERAVLGLP
jgi:hypothetical protein